MNNGEQYRAVVATQSTGRKEIVVISSTFTADDVAVVEYVKENGDVLTRPVTSFKLHYRKV